MATIRLVTPIRPPAARVFDLARSIDAHVASTPGTAERPVAGVTRGLIGLDETVTWEARHFGVTQRLTVRITAFQRPDYFEDGMISGAFQRMHHRHEFRPTADGTEMIDLFAFHAPLGPLGWLAEVLFLRRYLENLLRERAAILRRCAESDEWRNYLADPSSAESRPVPDRI